MNRLLEIILIVVAFETNSDDIFGSDESVTSAPEDDVSTISNYEGFDKTCFGIEDNEDEVEELQFFTGIISKVKYRLSCIGLWYGGNPADWEIECGSTAECPRLWRCYGDRCFPPAQTSGFFRKLGQPDTQGLVNLKVR